MSALNTRPRATWTQEGGKEERAGRLRRGQSEGALLRGRRSELARHDAERLLAAAAYQAIRTCIGTRHKK